MKSKYDFDKKWVKDSIKMDKYGRGYELSRPMKEVLNEKEKGIGKVDAGAKTGDTKRKI